MRTYLIIYSIVVIFSASASYAATKQPKAVPLPQSVPEFSKVEGGCFLNGEEEAFDDYIKSTAVEVSNCSEKFIPPTKSIIANRFYAKDSGGSLYDCAKLRANRFAPGGISIAVDQIVNYADKKLSKPKNSKEELQDAVCLANVIYNWAKADAITEFATTGGQADLVQVWSAGAIAAIYAKYPVIKQRAQAMSVQGGRMTKDMVIRPWFSKIGHFIADYAAAAKKKGQTNKQDHRYEVNTMYWRGFALTALGIHTEEVELMKRARDIFDTALGQITREGNPRDKGYLPHELLRRSKAAGYHGFALKPILGMVTLSKTMDCNFLRSESKEMLIGFLIRKTAEGGKNPKVFQEAAYCHINGGCKDGIVTMAQVEQSSRPKAGPLMPLLGKPSEAQYQRVMNHVLPYLKTRKVDFDISTSKPLIQSYIGGDVGMYTSHKENIPRDLKLREFCGLK